LFVLHPVSTEENICFVGVSPVASHIKKKPLYFSMASAVSYLCAKMQKASTNKFRLGIAHTIIELIQQPEEEDTKT